MNKIDPNLKLVRGSISLSRDQNPSLPGYSTKTKNSDPAEEIKRIKEKYSAEIKEEK